LVSSGLPVQMTSGHHCSCCTRLPCVVCCSATPRACAPTRQQPASNGRPCHLMRAAASALWCSSHAVRCGAAALTCAVAPPAGRCS
jgi:hypothetical protein